MDGCGEPSKAKEILDSLADLKRGEAWIWSPEVKFGPERIAFPMFKTFDSFAPPQAHRKISSKGWAGVDLDDVRTKLASVIEEQRLNDPRELKKDLAAAKNKISQLENAALKYVSDAAENKLVRLNVVTKPEKVFILSAADRKKIAAFSGTADQVEKQIKKMLEEFQINSQLVYGKVQEFLNLRQGLNQLFTEITKLSQLQSPGAVVGRNTTSGPNHHSLNSRPMPRTIHPPVAEISKHQNSELGSGAIKVLTAIAQRTDGASDSMIAVMTDYKGRSRSEYRRLLKNAGLIEEGGDGWIATQAGFSRLGDGFKRLPTGRALLEYWNQNLPAGELKLFQVFCNHYPHVVSNELLIQQTSYAERSVSEYKRLLTNRCLVKDGKACDHLFAG